MDNMCCNCSHFDPYVMEKHKGFCLKHSEYGVIGKENSCTDFHSEQDFNIFFYDLTEDAQKRYLAAKGLDSPDEANLDIFAITTV